MSARGVMMLARLAQVAPCVLCRYNQRMPDLLELMGSECLWPSKCCTLSHHMRTLTLDLLLWAYISLRQSFIFLLLTPGRVCRHFKSIQYCWEIPIAVIPKCHLLGNTCSIFGGICCNTCTLKQKRTFLVAVPPVGVFTNIKKESVSLRSAQNSQISEQTGWDSEGLSGDRRSNSIFNNAVFFLGFWRHLLNKGHPFYNQRSSRTVIAEPKG